MFWHIEKMFIALLCFRGCLATKFVSLNNDSCRASPTLIHLNPTELYYPFIISLDKCIGSSMAVDVLSIKIWVPIKKKW